MGDYSYRCLVVGQGCGGKVVKEEEYLGSNAVVLMTMFIGPYMHDEPTFSTCPYANGWCIREVL